MPGGLCLKSSYLLESGDYTNYPAQASIAIAVSQQESHS